MSRYQIATFCFNNEAMLLCESFNPQEIVEHRSGTLSLWKYPCTIADFIPTYIERVRQNGFDPHVMIFADQESRNPGSYEHSHLLQTYMPTLGYRLLKRTKMMGVGVTTYKGLLKGDPSVRGLRTSIYVKEALYEQTLLEESDIRVSLGYNAQTSALCDTLTRGKGATISYVKLPGAEILAVINCHLPFNAKSLINTRKTRNRMLRQTQLNAANYCFNYIFEEAVINSPLKPRHVIFTGDLNYRIDAPMLSNDFIKKLIQNPTIEHLTDIYQKYDELKAQMDKGNIYALQEGPRNVGPTFFPTCKMIKGRPRAIPGVRDEEYIPDLEDIDEEGNLKESEGSGEFHGVCFRAPCPNGANSVGRMTDVNIRNVGPFSATPLERSHREDVDFNLGKYYQRVPSWCDRILHTNFRHYGGDLGEEEKDQTLSEEQFEELEPIQEYPGPSGPSIPSAPSGPSVGYYSSLLSGLGAVGSYASSASQYVYSGSSGSSGTGGKPVFRGDTPGLSTIECVYYDRFDEGAAMNKSDHAAVYAIHEIVLG